MSNQILIDGELFDSETGELINEIQEVRVIVEEDKLPEIFLRGGTHIKSNIKQLETSLIEHLKTFDIEVTEDTEKDANKQATQLNKIAKELNSARLAVAKEIKKPADDLKIAVDGLIEIVQEKRTMILDKVEVFKGARFEKIKDLLEFELLRLYTAYSITEEYQTADITPLIREDSLAKVALSKKALEAIEGLVLKCQSIQNNVKIRLLELPLKCKELEIPLEEKDIKHIILLDDDEYAEKIDKLIEDRLLLETKMEENRLAKLQAQEKIEEEKEIKKAEEVKKVQEETGTKIVKITATFEVEVPVATESRDVLSKYRNKLFEDFTTLKTVLIDNENHI